MEMREQVESELRALSSSTQSSLVKLHVDKTIFRLRSQTNRLAIVEIDDPFVLLVCEIAKDKKLVSEIMTVLTPVRTLTEIGAIDARAFAEIFEVIGGLTANASEPLAMKILQTSLSAFMSPSLCLEPRISAAKSVFELSRSQSQMVRNIAMATAYQVIDVLFDQIVSARERNGMSHSVVVDFDKRLDTLLKEGTISDESDEIERPESDIDVVDLTHWAPEFAFRLMDEAVEVMDVRNLGGFAGLDSKNAELVLKCLLDSHYADLVKYETRFRKSLGMVSEYVKKQGDSRGFVMFAPHLIAGLLETDTAKGKEMISRLLRLTESPQSILNSMAVILTANPGMQFAVIGESELLGLAKQASRFFLSSFNGTLSESIVIRSSGRFILSRDVGIDAGESRKLISAVAILYVELMGSAGHGAHFLNVFDCFEGVWQRIVQTTEDPVTLESSLKVARVCVRLAVNEGAKDPSQRILSTIGGLAIPATAAYPLASKGVIALHSMIRLLQELNAKLIEFWPLIFETMSKCHHTAAHRRSGADLQALRLIQPSLLKFSTELDDDQFARLFAVIMRLSEAEIAEFVERKGTVPNFWLIGTISYIFIINRKRTHIIERSFFEHVKLLMQCTSSSYRNQVTSSLFDVAKEVVNNETSESCRQAVFDAIFQAANSPHREVTIIAFGGVLSFLAGGTAQNVREGWPMLLTVLKIVWATPFLENVPAGFRGLTFVCSDCLSFLRETDMEVCLSTISAYIAQDEDMNIALGSIGLLWNVGSYLAGRSSTDSGIWKFLFKTLQHSFLDKRQNIREAVLQTFFSIVNTFHAQFSDELKKYVVNDILRPLIEMLQEIESAALAIQGVIQCLRSLDDYKGVIGTLLLAVEGLSKKFSSSRASEAIRCFTTLYMFDDPELSKDVTNAFMRTVKVYMSKTDNNDVQGLVSVASEILPTICAKIEDDEFDTWLDIFCLFCSFQLDKPYLHVATHMALNSIAALPRMRMERVLRIIHRLISLIGMSCSMLSTKCFQIIAVLYVQAFDAEGRAHCMHLLLRLFQGSIATPECFECAKSIIPVEVDLNILLGDDKSVLRLLELARRNVLLCPIIVTTISTHMYLLGTKTFPAFLSLGKCYPQLYLCYFKFLCECDSIPDSFVERTKGTVCEAIEQSCMAIINEERVLGSVLPRSRYDGMFTFLEAVTKLDNWTVLVQELKPIAKLCETRCAALRNTAQSILFLICK